MVGATPELSVAVAANVAVPLLEPAAVCTVTVAGQLMLGGWMSGAWQSGMVKATR